MALKLYDDTNFSNIANAIRSKNSLATQYKPREMAAAITSLVTASDVLPTKNLVGASPLRFTDGGTGGKYTSAKVLIRPIQSGTGDPSPSNKRPVIEAERIKAYYRGADNQSYTTSWIVEDLPVYGYRDLITGITENLCDYNEDNIRLSNWSPSIVLYSDSGKNIFYLNENTSYNIIAAESLLLVDPVEDINDALANMPNNSIASPKGVSIGQVGLFIRADSYSSVADLLTAIGTDKIYFLKSSPVITTSTDVLTILTEYGVNSIKAELYNWNESPNALAEPNLDITYQADPTLYTQGVIMDMLPQDQVSGAIANFPDGSDGYPIVEGIFGIVPNQEGSGDPSPSNVRPISGFTGMNVTRIGKNLCKSTSDNCISYGAYTNYSISNNVATITGNALFGFIIPVKPNTTYTARKTTSDNNLYLRIREYSSYPTEWSGSNFIIQSINSVDNISTFTTGNTTKYILYVLYRAGTSLNTTVSNMQVEVGSTATDYEAYQEPIIKSVTWTDSAGTVYGGELNLTTGVLTVTFKMVNLSGRDWDSGLPNQDGYIRFVNHTIIGDKANGYNLYCNILPVKSTLIPSSPTTIGISGYSGNANIYMAISSDMLTGDLSTNEGRNTAFKAWISANNLQILYELATPVTYQLTPQELNTLLGTNNIYCDTGDSDIKYRADIDLYIQKKIAEG